MATEEEKRAEAVYKSVPKKRKAPDIRNLALATGQSKTYSYDSGNN